jgi:molybdopterin synthase sulfur carrier subunit
MARVLFFGRLCDAAGAEELLTPLPAHARHVSDLKLLLARLNPELGAALEESGVRVAINQNLAPSKSDLEISDRDEIAFMPPMSGG